MKLDEDKKEAIWYPLLARDDIHETDPLTKAPKMFHTGAHNDTDMYTGWRIYLRTNISYRYNGADAWKSSFDGRQVTLQDYEFILRFLLTGSHNLKRGNEMAADTSYGKNGFWLTAIYHPSALLRDLNRRPETFLDLLSIRDKVREVCPELYE